MARARAIATSTEHDPNENEETPDEGALVATAADGFDDEEDDEALVGVHLEEDWQQATQKPAHRINPRLAGLYRVEHGTLFFSKDKIVHTGRKVKLTAAEAFHFLHLDQPKASRPEKKSIFKLADSVPPSPSA